MTKDMAVQPWTAISIEHNSGHLAGRLYWPPKPRAGVVIAHGLDSSMQSSKLNQLGQGLKEAGMAALLFDHTGCGDSPGSHKETTLTTRRGDFLSAAAALEQRLPQGPIMYVGSSMGGAEALLAAVQKEPAALAVWVAPIDMDDSWRRLMEGPWPPDLPDMEADRKNYDMKALLPSISRVLFIYAERDDVVPPSHNANIAYELAREPKELWVVPGADHRFSDPADQEKVIKRSIDWFRRFI